MIGGLIEGILLAKLEGSDQAKVFTAKFAPRDKLGKTLAQKEWTLKNYIEVSHELGIITHLEKDIGAILRDYRNYIHPFKEKAHEIKIEDSDVDFMWKVCVKISQQVVK